MSEGWLDEDYIVLFAESEVALASTRYAIEAYLVLGGSLVVIARDSLGLRDARLQELVGLHEPSPGRLAGPPLALRPALLNSTSERTRAEIDAPPAGLFSIQGKSINDTSYVFRQGRDVLVQMRRHGQGVATLVRFDASSSAFREWNGSPPFWREIFDRADRYRRLAVPARDLVSAQQTVEAVPRMPRPPQMLLIGLGLLYVTLFGPLNLWILRRLRRTVRAWLVTPALAVVMTLVLLGAGSVWGSARENLNRLTILDTSSGVPFAMEETLVGVLTPAARGLTIRSDDPATLLRRLADSLGSGDEESLWPEEQGDEGAVWRNPTADELSLQLFASRGVIDLRGKVKLDLRQRRESLVGRVINETDMVLASAYLYDGKKYYRIGAIGAGASVVLPEAEPAPQAPTPPAAPGLTFQSRLTEFYEDAPQLRARARCDAVLVAHVASARQGLETPQFLRGESASVLLVRWRKPMNQASQ